MTWKGVLLGCCFVNKARVGVSLCFFLSTQKAGVPRNPVFLFYSPLPCHFSSQLLWMLMEEFIFGTGRVASCLEALRRPQNQFSLRARTSWRFRTCRKTGITLVSELDDNSDALICLSRCCLFQSIFKNSSLLALCNSRMWRFQRAGDRVCLVSGHVTGWLILGIRSWLTDFWLNTCSPKITAENQAGRKPLPRISYRTAEIFRKQSCFVSMVAHSILK